MRVKFSEASVKYLFINVRHKKTQSRKPMLNIEDTFYNNGLKHK